METIRRVYDEDMLNKKHCSIISPREDAQMFRNQDQHCVPAECITELYELLWRWGHRATDQPGFAKNFGFAISDTIIIDKGRAYAWYFISKRDGSLLRKSDQNLSLGAVEKKLCRDRTDNESPIAATWYPITSQFADARCLSPMAEFFTPSSCRVFLQCLTHKHSGVLQAFVEPQGVSNFLIRTVRYRDQTSLVVRTNRSLLASGRGPLFDRCATFEGWEGLSSSCSRYRSNTQPYMEDQILESGEMFNQRIEQEKVRQMLFLEPRQHVALHFKVSKDNMLYFIYASVVPEKEVILQTRPLLLMRDTCMTEDLPCQSLLPGGTQKKATPFEAPTCAKRWQERQKEAQAALEEMRSLLQGDSETDRERTKRDNSLPPVSTVSAISQDTARGYSDTGSSRRRALSARAAGEATLLPKMGYSKPIVPAIPYQIHALQHSLQESGRYEITPPFVGNKEVPVKRPLVSTTTTTTTTAVVYDDSAAAAAAARSAPEGSLGSCYYSAPPEARDPPTSRTEPLARGAERGGAYLPESYR